eukprot:TRINITY_DN8922_c0_g1_i1.p1 TRINITY_DN8922_c0_g1~~TRINITY_DN8922_c0_g1_i1.p1  ORF type:complete len:553 (+),score=123.41 TRINITY_DN8922_c0_g1_i1:23-1660(+)
MVREGALHQGWLNARIVPQKGEQKVAFQRVFVRLYGQRLEWMDSEMPGAKVSQVVPLTSATVLSVPFPSEEDTAQSRHRFLIHGEKILMEAWATEQADRKNWMEQVNDVLLVLESANTVGTRAQRDTKAAARQPAAEARALSPQNTPTSPKAESVSPVSPASASSAAAQSLTASDSASRKRGGLFRSISASLRRGSPTPSPVATTNTADLPPAQPSPGTPSSAAGKPHGKPPTPSTPASAKSGSTAATASSTPSKTTNEPAAQAAAAPAQPKALTTVSARQMQGVERRRSKSFSDLSSLSSAPITRPAPKTVDLEKKETIILAPYGAEAGEGIKGAVTELEAAMEVEFKLSRGFLVLFTISFGEPGKRQSEYFYNMEPAAQVECGNQILGSGDRMVDEYLFWRKSENILSSSAVEFQNALSVFMNSRKTQYFHTLSLLETKYADKPRIALFRMQDAPEEQMQPPRFGTVIVIWNAVQDSQFLSLQDRSLGVPMVLGSLLNWLRKRKIIEDSYSQIRDAGHTKQGTDEPLDYSTLFHKLFLKGKIS